MTRGRVPGKESEGMGCYLLPVLRQHGEYCRVTAPVHLREVDFLPDCREHMILPGQRRLNRVGELVRALRQERGIHHGAVIAQFGVAEPPPAIATLERVVQR